MADVSISRRGYLRAVAGSALVAGGAGTAAAQARPDFGGYLADARGGTVRDLRGQSHVAVDVGAGSGFAFLPTGVWVDPGTTVTWDWVSDGHNIVVDDRPGGADWKGTPGGTNKLYDAGYSYEHTFETGGIYTYFCQPHRSLGMLGAVAVGDDVPTAAGGGQDGGGGGIRFALPGSEVQSALLGAVLGSAGAGALLVGAADVYEPVKRSVADLREGNRDREVTLTDDQLESLRGGGAVVLETGDDTVTVNPPDSDE